MTPDTPILDQLQVYATQDAAEMQAVYQLTHDTFVRRGICQPQPSGMIIHNPQLEKSPRNTVLVVRQNQTILATLSLLIGHQQEEIYNYRIFAADLRQEPLEEGPFFSAWRLAVKTEGPYSRFLVLHLILHGMRRLLDQGITFGYMCFRKDHLQFYRRILPEGMLIGVRTKRTDLIDAELCMWKCYLSEERYSFLHRLVLKLCEG